MIHLDLGGRLGNQFFRYAFARQIDIKRGGNDDLILTTSRYGKQIDDSFTNGLSNFNVKPFSTTNISIYHKLKKIIKIKYKIICVLKKIFKINSIVFERIIFKHLSNDGLLIAYHDNYKFKAPSTKDVFIDGDFQSPEYFHQIKDILKKEFTPKLQPLEKNNELYYIIKNSNSVCIHVRRGDYLSEKYKKDFYVCDENYYKEAIRIIEKFITDPVFIFFSNDIGWVKDNLVTNRETYYEPSDIPLWESFRLMYCCKHFVISNSTLSWWAQYLSDHQDKLVISPDHWFNNPEKEKANNLILPDFTTIKCKYH